MAWISVRPSTLVVGFILLGSCRIGLGQLPPRTTASIPAAGFDMGASAYELSQATQQLATEVDQALRESPGGRQLVQSTRELARKTREFNDTNFYQQLNNRPDPNALRNLYVGVTGDWRTLKTQLRQPGLSTPAVDRLSQQIEQADSQLVQALGLVAPPQGPIVAPQPGPGDPRPDQLNRLVHQMSDQVNALAADIATDLGDTPSGRHMVQDAQELGRAVGEFHDTLHDTQNPFVIRQSFSGLDSSWHHLQGQLNRPGTMTRAVARAASRVDETDAQIHRQLGLATPPGNYYGAPAPPPANVEAQRLAYAVHERSQALARAIQAEMGYSPNRFRLNRDASRLVQETGTFYQRLGQVPPPNAPIDEFGQVIQLSDRLEADLSDRGVPPEVQASWQGFASAMVLLRQQIGLPPSPPAVRVNLRPANGGPSPAVALSEQLMGQVDAFLQAFGPTARNVPDGEQIFADAQRLREAAAAFQAQASRGIDPGRLAHAFQDVDNAWNRLSRRINRVAQGRTGPNIEMASRMGETTQQLHQVLGMPGYAPVLRLR